MYKKVAFTFVLLIGLQSTCLYPSLEKDYKDVKRVFKLASRVAITATKVGVGLGCFGVFMYHYVRYLDRTQGNNNQE